MIRRKCYEELGKRCVVKTESQEVFKKYTGIFAISSKGVIEKDPRAVKLTEAISEEVRKKSSQISSTDDNLDSIGLDELVEQYNDIKDISDPNKNTGFRNVLTGLTS